MYHYFEIESKNTSHIVTNSDEKGGAQEIAQASKKVSSLPPTNDRIANDDLISQIPSDGELQQTMLSSSNSNNSSYLSGTTLTGNSTSKSEVVKQQTKDKSNKRKSLLNTYSSEELLLQAASSLQGLEGNLLH